ncbi:hypothetical protein OBBRIDRAFT_804372 [Obba rivulosa]|uniref:Uncharacterized protein n=1 Tax=Obba rivulosa TaxID=1052685 RepID=A0A8E2AVA3_9APHY|nr:hypothetical protein OBBRIDRAFT_804372 [Obba rivulosa]
MFTQSDLGVDRFKSQDSSLSLRRPTSHRYLMFPNALPPQGTLLLMICKGRSELCQGNKPIVLWEENDQQDIRCALPLYPPPLALRIAIDQNVARLAPSCVCGRTTYALQRLPNPGQLVRSLASFVSKHRLPTRCRRSRITRAPRAVLALARSGTGVWPTHSANHSDKRRSLRVHGTAGANRLAPTSKPVQAIRMPEISRNVLWIRRVPKVLYDRHRTWAGAW